MIKQCRFDDATGDLITGNSYRVKVIGINEELLECVDEMTNGLGWLSEYDMSAATVREMSKVVEKFVSGGASVSDDMVEKDSMIEKLTADINHLNKMLEESELSRAELAKDALDKMAEIEQLKNQIEKKKRGRKPKTRMEKVDEKYNSIDGVDLDRMVALIEAGFDVDKLSVEFFRSKAVINMLTEQLFAEGRIKK